MEIQAKYLAPGSEPLLLPGPVSGVGTWAYSVSWVRVVLSRVTILSMKYYLPPGRWWRGRERKLCGPVSASLVSRLVS